MRFILLALFISASFPGWAEEVSTFPTEIVVVTGLIKEARTVQDKNISYLVSGARPEQLTALMSKYDFSNVRMIVSLGLAGGLNPNYEPGDIVIPYTIKSGHLSIPTNKALAARFVAQFLAQGIPVHQGILIGSDHVLTTPEEKQLLRSRTSADLVDMESYITAEVAAAHGIPFVALRVISDPATRALPAASAKTITKNGHINPLPIILSLARDPSQLRDLLQADRDSKVAFASLSQCGELLQKLN